MGYDDVRVFNGDAVISLLAGREREIMEAVRSAYQTHTLGDSCLPHSSFVRFPDMERERIIALPAFLGGDFGVAGMKWISSFPGNLDRGMERASAVLVLNSTDTGHLQAIMESSVVSAKRTAASAAVAGDALRGDESAASIGMIGCGLINFETFRFLLAARDDIESLTIFDMDVERAKQFAGKCGQLSDDVEFVIADSPSAVFSTSSILAIATTAVKPHISDLSEMAPRSVVLHTSLRDFTPEVILAADNVVDDVDHVMRAETSVHLAEQQVGHRDFVRCPIGDVFNGVQPARADDDRLCIFSPFGLGVLDLAVASLAYDAAGDEGVMVEAFLPSPWMDRADEQVR